MPQIDRAHLVRTARITGVLYLGLAVSGLLGFLITRPRLFDAGDPGATLTHLTDQPGLAAALVVFELMIVLTQALAAAWFYRLFRPGDPVSALGIGAFGLVNAVVILISAALLSAADNIAADPFGAAADTVQLLFLTSGELWAAGAIFFGLWLIPMGTAVLRTGWMPRPLGWVLIIGGAGYVLHAFAGFEPLTVPASIGEFWMIGYLLFRGVRRTAGSGDLHRDDVQLTAGGDGDVGAAARAQRDEIG
ncbi:hypothetical protein Aph02nite_78150 [Actinoplanes philippinensis]|uniref:DUF4386 domain-containing protein n=1 Tax=Actinoplanes philippinensis TaxID=35752 RepID=A0A1I2KG16_9ACTN|nr:DUF4386 domain-containing protein [Actinoplanes philippinensis]GIE81865.1 hypothetical protein Aph02nite_78150 [Actinoplanes philippinensis]SFF64177.1 protein of unknown function [Actinoplanes philippinensis]